MPWNMAGALPALLIVLGIILPLFKPQMLVTQGGKVMVNHLLRPGMGGWSGDRRLHVESDEHGRMVVDAPPGAATIEVAYRIGWEWPALAGLICIGLGVLIERRPAFGEIPVMGVN